MKGGFQYIILGSPNILCIEQMKKHPPYGMDDSFQIQGSSEKASSELDECLPQELLELKSRDAIIWQGVQRKGLPKLLIF